MIKPKPGPAAPVFSIHGNRQNSHCPGCFSLCTETCTVFPAAGGTLKPEVIAVNDSLRPVYVDVIEHRTSEGVLIPRILIWPDGRKFRIEKAEGGKAFGISKSGQNGRVFDIWIYGRKRRLYLQKDRYFVDSAARPAPAHDPVELSDEELLEIV